MNDQSCIMSTFMSINIVYLFRVTNTKNAEIVFLMKYGKNGKSFLFIFLIHFMLYIFNQFDKRNEIFMIRLINTSGTLG